MGCDEILQAFEHDSPGRKSHAFGRVGRKSGGNLVGVDKLETSQRLFQQERRSSRFAGAIWPGNHKYGGLLAAHGAVANTGNATATSVRPALRRSVLWLLSARVTEKVSKGLITTSLRWQVMGKFSDGRLRAMEILLKQMGSLWQLTTGKTPLTRLTLLGHCPSVIQVLLANAWL